MIHDKQSAQISQKQDERNIYVIMKTMCPPGYHHNGFVETHALGHNRTSCAQVHELPQSHCGDNQEGTLFFMITDTHTHTHTHTHNNFHVITLLQLHL